GGYDIDLEIRGGFLAPPQPSRLRSLDEGMCSASRYFATVRRATSMPRRFSSTANAWSDIGRAFFSSPISFLIMAWIAVAEAAPPSTVATPDEKKYLN